MIKSKFLRIASPDGRTEAEAKSVAIASDKSGRTFSQTVTVKVVVSSSTSSSSSSSAILHSVII